MILSNFRAEYNFSDIEMPRQYSKTNSLEIKPISSSFNQVICCIYFVASFYWIFWPTYKKTKLMKIKLNLFMVLWKRPLNMCLICQINPNPFWNWNHMGKGLKEKIYIFVFIMCKHERNIFIFCLAKLSICQNWENGIENLWLLLSNIIIFIISYKGLFCYVKVRSSSSRFCKQR